MRRVGFGVVGLLAAAMLWSMCAGSAHAQKADRPVRMQISGSVKMLGNDKLQVVTEKDEAWILGFSDKIVPSEDIKVTGEADLAWVQRGMNVRMSARINTKKWTFLDPITEFEIVAIRPGIEYMIKNENEPKDTDGLFEGKTVKKSSQKWPEEITAMIVGRIDSVKAGKIAITVPGYKGVKGELSEKCKIQVDVDNVAMIRVGDKVTIEGMHYEYLAPSGGTLGQGWIDKIEVVANEKFELPKPVKKGQKPYDNAKPGEAPKDGKAEEKPGKPAVDPKKPAADPKKKP
jgi:hypothetical protein